MQDMKKHLEKLRVESEECTLISKLAMDPHKRELFERLARHLAVLAEEIERTMQRMG